MNDTTPVAIIGAGPYGLSIAAHLRGEGVPFRIFGRSMHNWKHQMPKGMHLKSDGFASSLFDPGSTFTLQHYCKAKGIAYADTGIPVKLETFVNYGSEFQRRFVPDLEERDVTAIESSGPGFRLRFADGGTCDADRVVVAIGISYFESMPEGLAGLPQDYVSHSSKHTDLAKFKGRDVTVFGAGSSAIDIAALLHPQGAKVRMVTRGPALKFHVPVKSRLPAWMESIRRPRTGLGPGWRSRFCTDAPLAFRYFSENFRFHVVKRHLGPSPGWFIKKEDLDPVALLTRTRLAEAQVKDGKVHLRLLQDGDKEIAIQTDHVIAATGYKVDLGRLPFLEPIRSRIRTARNTPELSTQFESSLKGLYFVGLSSAYVFGPMLRFAYGAGFTARRISRHLGRVSRREAPKPPGAVRPVQAEMTVV